MYVEEILRWQNHFFFNNFAEIHKYQIESSRSQMKAIYITHFKTYISDIQNILKILLLQISKYICKNFTKITL